MTYIVREQFHQAGFDTPTRRHYPVPAETPKQALDTIKNKRPFYVHGIAYGLVPGSKLLVVGQIH